MKLPSPSECSRILRPVFGLASVLALASIVVPVHASPPSSEAEAYPRDAVLEWNQIAFGVVAASGQSPIPQLRSMAIVQVAVHDAVNGITGAHDTYLPVGAAPEGASPEAAAVAAAHDALVGLFPSQSGSLATARATSLAGLGLTEDDPGIEFGESVAAAILAERSDDGAAQAQYAYTAPGAGDPGVWVAIGTAAPLLPGWGAVTPFVLRSGSQFRPDGPPALDSGRYARDYNEIKAIGSLNGSTRTQEQTDIAKFWAAPSGPIWNPVARQLIEARDLGLSEAAQVLAMMFMAGSDAGVACWDAKYVYDFWRPQAAIQRGAEDGNDATEADPAWVPLLGTPPHPEYISGHTTTSSAMANVLALVFGDDPGVTIVGTSPTNVGFLRWWQTLSEGVDEVIDARVYSGIHFRTSDEVGARVGRDVARFVVNHSLR